MREYPSCQGPLQASLSTTAGDTTHRVSQAISTLRLGGLRDASAVSQASSPRDSCVRSMPACGESAQPGSSSMKSFFKSLPEIARRHVKVDTSKAILQTLGELLVTELQLSRF